MISILTRDVLGSNCRTRAAIWCIVLSTAAMLVLHAQSPGTITVRGTSRVGALIGPSAIDSQQSVYMAAGGAALGGNCTPMTIVKTDLSGRQVFSAKGPVETCGVQTGIKGITVDDSGNAFLTGVIESAGQLSGFVAKLSADGTRFLFTTNLPAGFSKPAAIQVDAQNFAYVAGTTSDFHPFVAKLSADGSAFEYTAVFLGTGATQEVPDSASALAVDTSGNVFVTGQTSSRDFPATVGGAEAVLPGLPSAFVAKLDRSGKILFSTFLGGSGGANGQAIRLDSGGNIYVTGDAGPDFPTTAGAYQPVVPVPLWSNSPATFIAKLRSDGGAVSWATYAVVNGSGRNSLPSPIELVVSGSGDVYLATSTGAGFVTTPSAPQPCHGVGSDVVLIHLSSQGALVDSTFLGGTRASALALGLPGDGSIVIAARDDSGPSLAQVRFGEPGSTPAACLSPDVVNAASFFSDGVLSPGELVSLTGFGIGPDFGVAYQPGPDGEVPASLGGVQVFFNGIPAPVLYAQSRQINAQVPFEVFRDANANLNIAVTLAYNGKTFGPYTMNSDNLGGNATGAIFRLQPGVSTQAAALNQDGSINGPTNPADRGTVVTFFGTGYGRLLQSCPTGGLNPPGPVPLVFSGSPVSGPVQYAGSAPGMVCGVVQFNMQVPLTAKPGLFLLTPYVNPGYGSTIFVR